MVVLISQDRIHYLDKAARYHLEPNEFSGIPINRVPAEIDRAAGVLNVDPLDAQFVRGTSGFPE